MAQSRAQRRFTWVTGIGVVVVLESGIASFLLRGEDALQLPFGRFVYGDLSPLAQGTRFGTAFIAMTLGFSLLAAILFLAWLTDRPSFLWPAFALGLVLCSGLSLSGHSADTLRHARPSRKPRKSTRTTPARIFSLPWRSEPPI